MMTCINVAEFVLISKKLNRKEVLKNQLKSENKKLTYELA